MIHAYWVPPLMFLSAACLAVSTGLTAMGLRKWSCEDQGCEHLEKFEHTMNMMAVTLFAAALLTFATALTYSTP